MIWHPLILAVLVSDLAAALLLSAAALVSFQVLVDWRPASSDPRQLRLEARCESASLAGRWAAAVFAFSTVLSLISICMVLPDVVPGAMCGTGVVQASQGRGNTAVLLRLLALGVIGLWFVVDGVNRLQPDAPLTTGAAKSVLVAYPLFCLAVWVTLQFAWHLDTQQPVDCCTVVYDQFTNLRQAAGTAGIPDQYWVGAFIGLSLLLGLGSLWMAMKRAADQRMPLRLTLAATTLLWGPVAAVTTVRVLSAYHFKVLHHHCPWCLFLPEHHLVGFMMLAALGVVLFEALVATAVPVAAASHPALADTIQRRLRHSAWRIFTALVLFLVLTLGPALLWRLRHGVWMGG